MGPPPSMPTRFTWQVDFFEELGNCVCGPSLCEKEVPPSISSPSPSTGDASHSPRWVQLVLCFAAGCLSVKMLEFLWGRMMEWWSRRFERGLAALEKGVTSLCESEAWEDAHAVLKEGLANLVRMRNGTPGEDRDIAALRHLQAKVCIRRQDFGSAEALLREIATAYEMAWGEDRHLAGVLEDLGSAVGSQPGREREGMAILGSAMRIHTSTVRDDVDFSQDLSRLADDLDSCALTGGSSFPSILSTPRKRPSSSSTPGSSPPVADSPAVDRLKALVAFMSERMEKRNVSPNTVTVIEPEAWSSP